MSDNNLGLSYEAVLQDLRAKRDAIDQAIDAIEKIVGITSTAPTGGSPASSPADIRPDSFFGLSIPEACRKFLRMSKAPKSIKEITDALDRGGLTHSSDNFMNTVGSVLHRLEKAGNDIVRVSRGQYGLAEWYPGMKRKRAAVKDDDVDEAGVELEGGSAEANDGSELGI